MLEEEKELIERARRGDLEAFNSLVIAYQNVAYSTAFRILGNHHDASDAVQEALIKAFKGLFKFKGGSFRVWLLRIVTNTCRDLLRASKRRPATPLYPQGIEPDRAALLSDVDNPENYAERQELARLIQEAIDQLPFDQKAVIILSDLEGFDYWEISEVLGIPLGTVKSRLSRARARVRDYLLAHQELLPLRYRLKP
ncbi:MAG: sigma-70 family RNA polymerase sigma factor [Anaerolineae bacterium]|nr:sigma-70 family RNA polymerase sigma factor [Anaerolineae bacterium]MDW8102006.1 sigma-70 family RNA polymerase sigma factor [Anaerolineae bacterium]